MRPLAIWVLILLASLVAAAQETGDASHNASLSGMVVKDPGGEPLKKAVLELIQETSGSAHNYTGVSDGDGHFEIHDILPGRYHLFVERTGFVTLEKTRHKTDGLTLSLEPGQVVGDLVLHMLPTAVVTGRVIDEDGDPMSGANVGLIRRRPSATSRFNEVNADRSNDLGQYRISGIVPGHYLLVVTPSVRVESILASKEKDPSNKPELAYVTTYYPNATDRAQATPIELRAGDEISLDFSLARTPTARLRGIVTNLLPGATATVELHATGGDLVFNEAEVGKDGKFEFRNVPSGSYNLTAVERHSDNSLVGRQTQAVNGVNIDGIRLVPIPVATLSGRIRTLDNARFDASSFIIDLHPVDPELETLNVFAQQPGADPSVKADGSFEWKGIPAGSYYVGAVATNDASSDFYVESITVGGHDIRDSPLVVNGAPVSVEIALSSKGAKINGTVLDDHDNPVANAVVVAVPTEKLNKRPDRFQKTATDQLGRFALRGILPGDYLLIACESLEWRDLADPEILKPYQDHAVAVHLEKSGQAHVSLKVQTAPED